MAAAQTLADVVAAYILNARARDALRSVADAARAASRRDELTGLGNRVQVLDDLDRGLRRARRPGHTVAVLYADLDRFKDINDLHGHRVGDELLVAVAERLRGLVRTGDSLGRMSGDEFVIVCDDLATAVQADFFARRNAASLAVQFALSALVVATAASVGIAFAARGDADPHDVLHAADMATYQAKPRGGKSHRTVEIDQQVLVGKPGASEATTGASAHSKRIVSP